MNHLQSPSHEQIISNQRKFVDTRTEFQKFWHFITGYEVALANNFAFAILALIKPHMFYLSFFMIALVTIRCAATKLNKTLPVKLPIELEKSFTDLNAPLPKRRKYKKASGTVMLGNLRDDGKEIWQEGGDLLTHGLVIGTTGAGKSEALISMVGATAFCMGGGVFYLDPKAGNKLLIQFVILCKLFGRLDDLRILNYKKGGVAIKEEHWRKNTNTFNPFALGGPSENFQILGMLIPSEAGQNESFLASAREVMKAILPSLCELRDEGILKLTPGLIADYLTLQRVADLYYKEEKNIYTPNEPDNVTFKLTAKVKRPLEMYLQSLQYDPEKSASKQNESVSRSFGYAKSYYGEPLANLAANFGHIYDFETPEISLEDVIFNNRILVSMLPAMENPPAEQKNLGKISLSAVKQAMSLGLGSITEGSFADILENLPVDLKVPFIIVADEYAEVAVPGFAVASTQGRGLGISVFFGSQDLEGLIRADKEEAGMIFGNTLNKWLMRTQDPDTTWKKFKELASTVSIAESANFGEAGGYLNRFSKETSAVIKEVDTIHFGDIVSQIEGEAHFFERGKVHRINSFYHGIDEKKFAPSHRYNRLLSILPPSERDLEVIRGYIDANKALETSYNKDTVYPEIPSLNSDNAWLGKDKPFALFTSVIDQFNSQEEVHTSSSESKIIDEPQPEVEDNPATTEVEIISGKTNTMTPQMNIAGIDQGKSNDDLHAINADLKGNVKDNTDSDSINTDTSVKAEVASELASDNNHWLFSSVDNTVDTVAEKLAERLKQYNKAIYGDDDNLINDDELDKVVNDVAQEMPYTSRPPVQPKSGDIDEMWKNMDDLFGQPNP